MDDHPVGPPESARVGPLRHAVPVDALAPTVLDLVRRHHQRRASQPPEREVERVVPLLEVDHVGIERAQSPHELPAHPHVRERLVAPCSRERPDLNPRVELRLDVVAQIVGEYELHVGDAGQRAREPGGRVREVEVHQRDRQRCGGPVHALNLLDPRGMDLAGTGR